MKALPGLCLSGLLCLGFTATGFSQNIGDTVTGVLSIVDPNVPTSGSYYGGAFSDYQAGLFVYVAPDQYNPDPQFAYSGFLFEGFCVEPVIPMSYGDVVTFTYQDPALLDQSDSIARLLTAYSLSEQSSLHKQAIQWAIWEVLLDGPSSPDFANGDNRLDLELHGAIGDLALSYLTDLNSYAAADFYYLTADGAQNIVVLVPEPATMGLTAFAGVFFFLRRRR